MRPGAPSVIIERGGVTLHAQRVWGDQFGGQVVQTEDGSFHVPSKAALFPDYTPHSVAIRVRVMSCPGVVLKISPVLD